MESIKELNKIFPKKIETLEKFGWELKDNGNVSTISNSMTGCTLKSTDINLLADFISEKYNELEEERLSNRVKKASNEEILSYYGYLIVCESPFEIKDKEGNLTTGECAKFTLSYLREKYNTK